jgi:hypothetical protein
MSNEYLASIILKLTSKSIMQLSAEVIECCLRIRFNVTIYGSSLIYQATIYVILTSGCLLNVSYAFIVVPMQQDMFTERNIINSPARRSRSRHVCRRVNDDSTGTVVLFTLTKTKTFVNEN